MLGKRTYVLSIHDVEGHVLLEEVRTRRRARLVDVSEIAAQIDRWAEPESDSGDRMAIDGQCPPD